MATETTSKSPLAKEITENWPALSFYYGLGWNDLRAMPRWARDAYSERLAGLLASEQLRLIQASSFPWMDDRTRSRIQEDLLKHLPDPPKPQAPRNKMELQLAAAASGIGVVFEPKPEEVK